MPRGAIESESRVECLRRARDQWDWFVSERSFVIGNKIRKAARSFPNQVTKGRLGVMRLNWDKDDFH